jgi:hypothetical protein
MRLALAARAIAAALVAAALCAAPVSADDLAFPPDHHPWGHFPVHSWKRVRTTAETLNEKGDVASVTVTDSKTTLVAADDKTYTLTTDATVNVASRIFNAPQQTAKHGYYGEKPGQPLVVKHVGESTITIDGRAIPCDVRQVTLPGDSGNLIGTIHYSNQFPPFVLRRETSAESAAEEAKNTTLVEVVALDLPQRVRGELKHASYVKTTQKLPQGARVTLEVHCDDVPGGVVAHWASETDASGRVVKRSTLELIDYSVPSPVTQPQPGLFRRPIRGGKAIRRMDPR